MSKIDFKALPALSFVNIMFVVIAKMNHQNSKHLKQGIQQFHEKFVLAPADKANNNAIVV